MPSNFKIIRHQNSDNLHLKLIGKFDGGAAMELVNMIQENAGWFKRIFIHTCGLTSISTFGSMVFTKNIRLSRLRSHQLKITGSFMDKMYQEVVDVIPGSDCGFGQPHAY